MNERVFIKIDGIRQGIFIQGEGAEKPALPSLTRRPEAS